MLFLILSVITLGLSQSTGCMSWWYVAITDNIASPNGMVASQSILNEQCFSQIDDFENLVYGHLTNAECYIHENYFYHQAGADDVSRCGQCLELTGPTQQPLTCMLAGTFYNIPTSNLTEYDQERILFVSDENYDYIATVAHGAINHATQLSVRVVSCPFPTNPSLFVISSNETSAVVQPINFNVLHKLLIHDGVLYPINNDGTYTVPVVSNSSFVMVSVNNSKLKFLNVDTSIAGSYYLAENQFPSDITDEVCEFYPEKEVFGDTVVNAQSTPVMRYYTWTPTVFDGEQILRTYNIFGATNIPIDDQFDNKFFFSYPSVMQMAQTFSELDITIEYNNDDFEIANPFLLILDYNGLIGSLFTEVCSDMQMEQENNNETNTSVIRISLIKRECEGFASALGFSLKTGVGTSLNITDARFVFSETHSQYNHCKIDTYMCKHMECVPDGVYEEGCEPNCGSCVTGYQCNEEGTCVKNPKLNTRSWAKGIMVIGILFVLLLI
ncbi:Uncharacterized protein QTN25_004162 [Entamoeba marina]